MKKTLLLLAISAGLNVSAQIPKFDHVVFVLEENYAYSEIIGSSYAPTLTALAHSSYCANFTKAYAITHPSEPNYLDLYSGNNQGVTTDISGPASNAPFNDCNLGASVIAGGGTFIGYSEDQPGDGWIAGDNGNYATKHCPWINWQNGSTDVVPDSSDLEYAFFPDSNHYSTLPTVSWVIPNQVNDMHNGSSSTAIPAGDNWFSAHMMPLVRWANVSTNKTLVLVIWDEDDGNYGNNIPCLFASAWVNGGNYSTTINHYSVLRTIEDMYSLPLCGSSATATDVPEAVWNFVGINSIPAPSINLTAGPVPTDDHLNVTVSATAESNVTADIIDITGRIIKSIPLKLKDGSNNFIISTSDMPNGIYSLRLGNEKTTSSKKFMVAKP